MTRKSKSNIRKLPSGRFGWRKRVKMPDGSSKRLTNTKDTFSEAQEDMFKTVGDVLQKIPVAHIKSLTIADLVESYIDTQKDQWAPATLIHNQGWFDRHIKPAIGNTKVVQLTPEMLQKFYRERKGVGSSGLNQIKCLLNGAYKMGMRKQLIRYNPVELQPIAGKRNREEKKIKFFSVEEAELFNAAAKNDRFGMILSFLLLTGMRIGEACGLQWTDIQKKADKDSTRWGVHISTSRSERNGQIIEGPTKSASSTRFIYISQEAAELLENVKNLQKIERSINGTRDQHVFLSTTGHPIRQDTVRHVMKRICQDVGIRELSPHALRHTFASIMISKGMDITQVSRHLGHEDIKITLVYYRHLFDAERQAVTLSLNPPDAIPEKSPHRRTRKPINNPQRQSNSDEGGQE